MDKYADGVKTEVDTGYRVSVKKVMYAEGVADESGDFEFKTSAENIVKDNTQYLVTLDVNGVNKLFRDLWTSGDFDDNNVVDLGDYTFTMDEQSINKLEEDDAVVVRFEEVVVKTSDAFRAAVSKVAPKSEGGGGSGGGVLVVTDTEGTLDKTWQEIVDADFAVVRLEINDEEDPPPRVFVGPVIYHYIDTKEGYYSIGVLVLDDSSIDIQYYVATSADGYPTTA